MANKKFLILHKHGSKDIQAIAQVDKAGARKIVALYEQLKADQDLLEKLLDSGYVANTEPAINVKEWISLNRNSNKKVFWRLRVKDFEIGRYRLFYLFYYKDQTFYVLAVQPRGEVDYDDTKSPLAERLKQCLRDEFPDA